MKNLQQEDWRSELSLESNAVILDVRSESECASGIIPNAIQIDFLNHAHFMDEIEKLDKSVPYYIYCRSGNRSGQACTIMNQMGFTKTINLAGGMLEWNGEVI